MGRPRKPTHLHLISGTARKHRINPDEPRSTPGTPTPPSWLSPRAAEIFYEIVADLDRIGTLAVEWGPLIADYASCREEVEVTSAVLEDLGRTYTLRNAAGDVVFRARPEVGMRSSAMRRAQILRSELGLGPASKAKVSVSVATTPNPFTNL